MGLPIGQKILIKTKKSDYNGAFPWAEGVFPVRIVSEHPYFYTASVLPHRTKGSRSISGIYNIALNKIDIYTSEIELINEG